SDKAAPAATARTRRRVKMESICFRQLMFGSGSILPRDWRRKQARLIVCGTSKKGQENAMQNKTKLALAAGIAGLIGLGTAGAAQADWDGHHGFGRGMCGMAGMQMGGMHPGMGFWFHQLMERYD